MRQTRLAPLVTVLGGLLWAPYGVFEMVQPWGEDTLYRDDLGYEVVLDAPLHRVYSLPGGLALLLTALGLLALFGRRGLTTGLTRRAGVVLTNGALALAVLSVVGVGITFDPLFTGPRIFGTLALGAATLLAGIEARRTGTTSGGTALLLTLGLLGLILLPLWPLVNAIEVVPEGVGAAVIALFGLGWALLGFRHATSGPMVREAAR